MAASVQLNPVTRVVQLMEGLVKKCKADGEAEQELYDKFKCWCKKVINAKTTTMAANEARIDELAQYIDDLESGRIELTSERTDLEAEIKGLEKTIEEETTMREKEHEDFVAAKDEMDKAIAALKSAIDVLAEGTAPASLVSSIKRVMRVGQGFLAKNDLSELHKILDVPTADWKKLNREATFKKKYEARSGGIQDILKDMLKTFEDNLEEATAAEEKAEADFDALMEAKKTQLSTAKQALLDKSGEKGARGEALAASKEEKEDLEGQNERDAGYLSDTKKTCEERATEWDERKKLRAEEIAAIQEAIGILHSDDARDTFKKSFDSQGLFFTQLNQLRHKHPHRGQQKTALSLIKSLASSSKDIRVAQLVVALGATGAKEEPNPVDSMTDEELADPFKEVIAMIDGLIEELETEESDDLKTKEQCEKERMENTQEAKMVSKEIDTNVETIDRLTAQIEEAEKMIKQIEAEIQDLEVEIRDAGDNRAKENAEYMAAEAEDNAAVELVSNAMGVLEKFYEENGLKFTQLHAEVRRAGEEPFVAAGEAPTPPPAMSTTDGSRESKGVIMMLEMIKEDIEKDIAKAKKQEEEAQAAYDKLVEDIEAAIQAKEQTKSDLEGEMASDSEARTQENTTMADNQGQLKAVMDYLKEIAPGCDFIAMNFNIRLTNRQMEVDGLKKAKSILQGAEY